MAFRTVDGAADGVLALEAGDHAQADDGFAIAEGTDAALGVVADSQLEKGGRKCPPAKYELKRSGRKGLFHAPHPGSVMKKGSVKSARQFLRYAGITPASEGCRC